MNNTYVDENSHIEKKEPTICVNIKNSTNENNNILINNDTFKSKDEKKDTYNKEVCVNSISQLIIYNKCKDAI